MKIYAKQAIKFIKDYCKEDGIELDSVMPTMLALEELNFCHYECDWFLIYDALGVQESRDEISQSIYLLATAVFMEDMKDRKIAEKKAADKQKPKLKAVRIK